MTPDQMMSLLCLLADLRIQIEAQGQEIATLRRAQAQAQREESSQ